MTADATTPPRTGAVVRGLTVRDGTPPAVRDIVAGLDLELLPGRRVGIVGPSSADVTTVLATVAGLRPAASGTVVVDGVPLPATASPLQVGYLSQDHRLIGTLTAVENVLVTMLAGRQQNDRDSAGRAEQQLEELALAPATWHNLVEQLSGGQQQRVALGRALVLRPSLLVLDHPTSELDPDSVALVDGALRRAQDEGCAVLLAAEEDVLLAGCDLVVDLAGAQRAGSSSTSRRKPRADRNADNDSR